MVHSKMRFILRALILLHYIVTCTSQIASVSRALICANLIEPIVPCSASSIKPTSQGDAGADKACLHRPASSREPSSPGGWIVDDLDTDQWIQADLVWRYVLTSISTQGRNDVRRYVSSYRFLYGDDGDQWHIFTDDSGSEILQGNDDSDTVVSHDLGNNITARFVRINPQSWGRNMGFRWEIYGYASDDFNEQETFYAVNANTKAENEAYEVITTSFVPECTDKCAQNRQCWACNFNEATNNCELLRYAPEWDLIDTSAVTFYLKSFEQSIL